MTFLIFVCLNEYLVDYLFHYQRNCYESAFLRRIELQKLSMRSASFSLPVYSIISSSFLTRTRVWYLFNTFEHRYIRMYLYAHS